MLACAGTQKWVRVRVSAPPLGLNRQCRSGKPGVVIPAQEPLVLARHQIHFTPAVVCIVREFETGPEVLRSLYLVHAGEVLAAIGLHGAQFRMP